MENKQTAVEWLFLKMNRIRLDYEIGNLTDLDFIENQKKTYNEAKQMEKEQNREFYNEGKDFSSYTYDEQYGGVEYWDREPMGFEQYYNETYGK